MEKRMSLHRFVGGRTRGWQGRPSRGVCGGEYRSVARSDEPSLTGEPVETIHFVDMHSHSYSHLTETNTQIPRLSGNVRIPSSLVARMNTLLP